MVEYADFHATVTTLAPLLLAGAAVWLRSRVKDGHLKSSVERWLALPTLYTLVAMVVSLLVLGGFWQSTPFIRQALLLVLVCNGALAVLGTAFVDRFPSE
jgi:hypothetical protein